MPSNGYQPGGQGVPAFPEEDAPALGADYEEVARYAAFRGNTLRGTTAERDAFAFRTDGLLWSNTSLDTVERWDAGGGKWDTVWAYSAPTAITASAGWTANTGVGFGPTVTRTNDMVAVYGGVFGGTAFSEAFVVPSFARVARTTTVPYIGYTGTPESPSYVHAIATVFTSGSVTLSHNLHPRSQLTWNRR